VKDLNLLESLDINSDLFKIITTQTLFPHYLKPQADLQTTA
jgi:hypothetical protein